MTQVSFSSTAFKIGQAVAVLPGGQFQARLISKARQCGYRVVCADRAHGCPGERLADHFVSAGLDERDRLLENLRRWNPAAVVTDQTDTGVATVAWLCDQLGLPGIGMDCAELFTNKSRMREFCRQHGFHSPVSIVGRTLDEVQQSAHTIGFPVVIKPLNNQSSKGVHRANNESELAACLTDTLRHAADGRCLVERFLAGTEFTVEGFKSASGHRTLAISEKSHYSTCPMVAKSLLFSPHNPRFDYAQLRATADAWVNASNLPFGITHAEYIYSDGQFQLVEIAARGGGTHIASDIVPWVSGIDPQLLLLEASLGRPAAVPDQVVVARHALLEFFEFATGCVRRISGLDAARGLPGVFTIQLAVDIGRPVPQVRDDTTRAGYFILLTDTLDELIRLREQVLRTIRVECE